MLLRLLAIAAICFAVCGEANAQPQPLTTFIVANCGTLPTAYTAGQFGRPVVMDINGNFCTNASGGGGGGTSSTFGSAFPATGTAIGCTDGTNMVACGTATNPLRTNPTGTTTQPVSLASPVGAGTSAAAIRITQGSDSPEIAALGTPADVAWSSGNATLIALGKAQVAAIQGDVPSVTGPLAAATAAATKSLIVGGQFLTTQPTMTNTQQASLLFSPRGAVYVMTGAEKLLVTPDSVALPANQSVNVAQINGVAPLMGDGVTGTGSHRFTLATNGSALTTAGFMSVKLDQTTDGTTNSVSAHGAVNVTPTNCGGTITAGGTAQNAHTAQSTLKGVTIANLDTSEVMWVSFTSTAASADTQSYPLAPATATTFAGLSSYTTPLGFGYNTALSVIAATTGHKFACTRW